MPERFEIYIVYKRRYINTLPFLFPLTAKHVTKKKPEIRLVTGRLPACLEMVRGSGRRPLMLSVWMNDVVVEKVAVVCREVSATTAPSPSP